MRSPITLARFAVLSCLVLGSSPVFSQYYEPREYHPSDARYFTAGVVQREFSPRGSNSLPESLALGYDRLMPMVSFRQGPVDIQFGYTSFRLLGRSRASIFFGATVSDELPLSGKRPSALVVPILLAADFTKTEGIGFERENFNIASVGIGLGLKYHHIGEEMDFSLSGVQVFHYSTEGFSTGTGFSAATLGEALILLRSIRLLEGVAIGYRFRLQTWAMSNSKFNYRAIAHGPFIGILF